jgi:hypothetical protein
MLILWSLVKIIQSYSVSLKIIITSMKNDSAVSDYDLYLNQFEKTAWNQTAAKWIV